MRYTLMLFVVFLMPACSVVSKMTELATKANEALAKANEVYETGKSMWDVAQDIYKLTMEEMKAAKVEADADKDGTTTFDEWWGWITSGGLAAWIARERLARQREQMLARNEVSDLRKAQMEAEISDLKAKLKS